MLRFTRYMCQHCFRFLKTHPVWRNGCAIDEPDACTCTVARLFAKLDQLSEEKEKEEEKNHDE